jgi:flagellar hook-associated protein 1 FlgK
MRFNPMKPQRAVRRRPPPPTAAATLARGLNSATATVNQVREQADSEIATSVQTINALLAKLQPINTQIINGNATGTDVTNAQDMRDDILTKLSHEIGVTTTVSTNGDMSIYTDSGATLFQGGVARSVTFAATNSYTPATVGNVVYADGIPITGSSAAMPVATGNIAGLSHLRDTLAVTYQAQMDGIAGALHQRFRRNPSTTGLADQIMVNASVDPSQGGNALLLRDGGISDTTNSNYTYNQTGDASYAARLSQLLTNLSAP